VERENYLVWWEGKKQVLMVERQKVRYGTERLRYRMKEEI
jgi:hypothetical protein